MFSGPNLLGSTDAQLLSKYEVGKDEGSLRVTTPVEDTPPLHGHYFREPAPHCFGGRGVPASWLRGHLVPMTPPNSVVRDSTIQVRPAVVMREISIDYLQQQVHTFGCKVWQVCALLLGGHAPPWRKQILILTSSYGALRLPSTFPPPPLSCATLPPPPPLQ